MIEQALARTGTVTVDAVWHTPEDGTVATERSPAASLTFTASGAWWLKSFAGAGQVDPGWLLVLRPGDEYECRHPHGVADRSLSVTFLREMEPVSGSLVRVGEQGRKLRRRLYRAVTARHPDPEEIDAVAVSLLAWARRPGEELVDPAPGTIDRHADGPRRVGGHGTPHTSVLPAIMTLWTLPT